MDIRKNQKRLAVVSPRERFRRTMHFQATDHIPHIEFGYWPELKERWYEEGHLPKSFKNKQGDIPDNAVEKFFGCEESIMYGPNLSTISKRKTEILEEKDGKRICKDPIGIIYQEIQEEIKTIPHYLEFPIKDRPSWERFRDEFLQIGVKERKTKPSHLKNAILESRKAKVPVGFWYTSFLGELRNWMGFETCAIMSIEDPKLLEEMVGHLTNMKMHYSLDFLKTIEFDFAAGWEDICFNSGPLINPNTFKSIVFPYIKTVIKMLRQHGIDIIYTDCDGNVKTLIPIWLDAGLNCLFPCEIRAGNDPVELRKEYGESLLIRGGFDKFALLEGKESILKELKRLESVVAEGGFIPHIDHRTPDGVSFKNYQYYIKEKCHLLGMSKDKIKKIPGL